MTDKYTIAKIASDEIWSDLTDRSGVGDSLEGCDDEIQEEIRETITRIVLAALTTNGASHDNR